MLELMYASPWWTTLWIFLLGLVLEMVLRTVAFAIRRTPRGPWGGAPIDREPAGTPAPPPDRRERADRVRAYRVVAELLAAEVVTRRWCEDCSVAEMPQAVEILRRARQMVDANPIALALLTDAKAWQKEEKTQG